jgi:pimeloyl-ACP methyl ester carboxylesterase
MASLLTPVGSRRPNSAVSGRPPRPAAVVLATLLGLLVHPLGTAADTADAVVREVELETSDGVTVAAWYFPPTQLDSEDKDAKPKPSSKTRSPVAILVHDLEGSHEALESVAGAIQESGCGVIALDLRGHGESRRQPEHDPRRLKKSDFDAMAMSGGGQKRDQATAYGEVEAARRWLADKAADEVDVDRLFVVGSGVGGTVAAIWAANDWAWPDIATGPQGRSVQAVVLISPAFTARGFSIAPALNVEPLRRSGRVLILAGTQDRDAARIFDQLKSKRPQSWLEQRGQADPEYAPQLVKKSDAAAGAAAADAVNEAIRRATVLFFQLDSPLRADALAADKDIDLGPFVANFLLAVPREPER